MKNLLLLLLIAQSAQADYIAVRNRVKNKEPGYCCWSCLETLGRHYKNKVLYDLVEKRSMDEDFLEPIGPNMFRVHPKNSGSPMIMQSKLNSMGVKHWISNRVNTLPCITLMNPGAFGPCGHAIILFQIDSEQVHFIDPNRIDMDFRATRRWFEDNWSGVSLFLEREQ